MDRRRSFRTWLAEHLLHIGWAIFGQECECGANRFNWAAKLIGEGDWTDDGEPSTVRTRVKFWLGSQFIDAYSWLMKNG